MTFNRLDTAFCGAIIVVVALAVVLPTATASTAAREGSESFRRAHPLSTLVVPENKDTPRLIRLHDDDMMHSSSDGSPKYADVHALLATHNVFGIPAGASKAALRLTGTRRDAVSGHVHESYQQFHHDIPVFGGVIKTASRVLDSGSNAAALRAVSGTYNDHVHKIDAKAAVPSITADAATTIAFKHVSGDHDLNINNIVLSRNPELSWINPSHVDHNSKVGTVLAWRMHMANEQLSVHRNLFVAAGAGKSAGTVVADYSLVSGAHNRTLYEVSLDSEPTWSEGDAPLPPGELNNTIVGAGLVFDVLKNGFGRFSYDGEYSEMITVYNETGLVCPNAQWTGYYTRYCPGVAEVDIVAHEWGHALTQTTAGLVYLYQTGALNEAYSDILGTGVVTNLYNTPNLDLSTRSQDDACSSYSNQVPPLSLLVGATSDDGTSVELSTPIAVTNMSQWSVGMAPNFPGDNLAVEVDAYSSYSSYFPVGGLACDPIDAVFVEGDIVLVNRGVCSFDVKMENVIAAGGSGMIVVNYEGAPIFPPNLFGAFPEYPVGMISSDGVAIQEWIAEGRTIVQDVETFDSPIPLEDSYRWLVGPTSPAFGGAIRDMWNPTCFGHPDSVGSELYHCSSSDNGGVHVNSGIPNRLFALAVDGSEDLSINGIGVTKAYHIHYHALFAYHTVFSSFADHGAYLAAACEDLVGINLPSLNTSTLSGEMITLADCDELDKAITATGILEEHDCDFEPTLPESFEECDGYSDLPFFVDFSVSDGGFTVENSGVFPEWIDRDWTWGTERGYFNHSETAWHGPNPFDLGTCQEGGNQAGVMALSSPNITVTLAANTVFSVAFVHVIMTEPQWDGGIVTYSINGGDAHMVPDHFFTTNSYNSAMRNSYNPLAGLDAFSSATLNTQYPDPAVSSFVLPDVADGDVVQISFVLGVDGCGGFNGWDIYTFWTFSCGDACGDGFCGAAETCQSCPFDCDCECGDGVCEQDFDHHDCALDCHANGICEDGEFSIHDCCGLLEDCYLTDDADTWAILPGTAGYPFDNDGDLFRGPDMTGLTFVNGDNLVYYAYYPSYYGNPVPEYFGVEAVLAPPPPGQTVTMMVDMFATCGMSLDYVAQSPDIFSIQVNGVEVLGFDNDTSATNDLCTNPADLDPYEAPQFGVFTVDITDHLTPGETSSLVIESHTAFGVVFIDRIRMMMAPMPTTTAAPTTTVAPTTSSATTEAPDLVDCVDPTDVSQLEGACTEFCEDNVCDDTTPFIGLMIAGWVVALLAIFGLLCCAMKGSKSNNAGNASSKDDAELAPQNKWTPSASSASVAVSSAPAVSSVQVSSTASIPESSSASLRQSSSASALSSEVSSAGGSGSSSATATSS